MSAWRDPPEAEEGCRVAVVAVLIVDRCRQPTGRDGPAPASIRGR